jgi:hypothetical protein
MDVSGVLKIARDAWQAELNELELKVRPTLAEMSELRSKIEDADKLIVRLEGNSTGQVFQALSRQSLGQQKRKRGQFTPTQAYWAPILEALVEMGGRADVNSVLRAVEGKMSDILTPQDLERLPNNSQLRWENRVNWQRLNMVRQGLLRSDSPRGVWEINDAGREWLKKH